jgi:hypothetical protein
MYTRTRCWAKRLNKIDALSQCSADNFSPSHGFQQEQKLFRRVVKLVFALFESLDFPSLAVYLSLLLIDSLLLLVLLHFMPLKLVANQSARSQAEQTANRRASPGVSHGATNDTAGRGAAECADAGSLFSRR